MSELPPSYQRQAPRGKFMDFAPRKARPRSATSGQSVPSQSTPVRPPVRVDYTASETTVVSPDPYPHAVAHVSSAQATITPVAPVAPINRPPRPSLASQRAASPSAPQHSESQLERIRRARKAAPAPNSATPEDIARPATPVASPRSRRADYDDYLELEDYTPMFDEPSDAQVPADAPDNSRFIFGGKSPFINLDKVPKRPLGPSKKATLEEVTRKTKNTYAKRQAPVVKDNVPTIVMGNAQKASNISLVIAIILTVILGAVVGAIAYLAFFQ